MKEKPIYKNGHRSIPVNNFESKKSLMYPLSFFHLSLMEYSPAWSIDQIVLFEKFIVFYRWNKLKPFEYQQIRLIEQLHTTRDRIERARKSLKNSGILNEFNPGLGKKIRYLLVWIKSSNQFQICI